MLTGPYIKAKLGAHLSYPLAFGELQTLLASGLAKVPLEIWFYAWKAPRKNERRQSYTVLEARYSPPADWRLFVRPIPRELRPTVHSLLPVVAGQLDAWLIATRPPVWFSFGHALFIDYVPDVRQFTVREFNKG